MPKKCNKKKKEECHSQDGKVGAKKIEERENDKLSAEELQQTYERLLEVLKCPVCLDPLRKGTIFCNNGHPLCSDCMVELLKCPLCRAEISSVKATLVNQLVEILPRPCRYDCSKIVKPRDDHEKFCSFKLMTCKVCNCSLRAKDILDHVKNVHRTIKVLNTVNVSMFGAKSNNYMTLESDDPLRAEKHLACTSVDGHFVWLLLEKIPRCRLVFIRFFCVPNGKPVNKWFGRVELRSNTSHFTMDIKLNPASGCEVIESCFSNSVAFAICMLPKFVTNKNCIKFHIQINSSKLV